MKFTHFCYYLMIAGALAAAVGCAGARLDRASIVEPADRTFRSQGDLPDTAEYKIYKSSVIRVERDDLALGRMEPVTGSSCVRLERIVKNGIVSLRAEEFDGGAVTSDARVWIVYERKVKSGRIEAVRGRGGRAPGAGNETTDATPLSSGGYLVDLLEIISAKLP